MQRINTEAVTAEAEADVERGADDRDDGGASPTIADASALMNVAQHYFLDNEETLRSISDCLKGGGIAMEVSPSMSERVDSMTSQLSRRLERKLLTLPKHVRHNFVWAACRDNIHSFVQLLALLGQLPQQVTTRSVTDSIIKPHELTYHRLLDGHSDDATLNGVTIYINTNTLRPVRVMLAWDKSFLDSHTADERNAKNAGATAFSKRYPFTAPSNPELGGWDVILMCSS